MVQLSIYSQVAIFMSLNYPILRMKEICSRSIPTREDYQLKYCVVSMSMTTSRNMSDKYSNYGNYSQVLFHEF